MGDEEDLLGIAGIAAGLFVLMGELIENDEGARLPWAARAQRAAASVMPQRLVFYHRFLMERIEQEDAMHLKPTIPDAVKFVLALTSGIPSENLMRWRKLVRAAGPEDAEWLVSELLVDTDMLATSQIPHVCMAWARAAYESKVYPPCMQLDAKDVRPARQRRRRRR